MSKHDRITQRAEALFNDDDSLAQQLSMFFIWLSPTSDADLNRALQALRERDYILFGAIVRGAMQAATHQEAKDQIDEEDADVAGGML